MITLSVNGKAETALPIPNQAESGNEEGNEKRKATIAFIKKHYVRIGPQYKFRASVPNIDGRFQNEAYIDYTKEAIKDDFAKSDDFYVKVKDPHLYVERYAAFTNIPSHTNYKEVIGEGRARFLNRYRPIPQKPAPGRCDLTLAFIRHIFGDQFAQGVEYLKVLYEKPTQILPILCLQSKARDTGKTTFLNFLRLLFGENVTLNTNEDLQSRFNTDWTGKLIIGVDETLLDKRTDSERLKNLSTAKTAKTEGKGKDKVEGAFFGKFILCANPKPEHTWIIIDPEEIRYWVREVPPVPKQIKRNDLLADLEKEVPAFLHYLANIPYLFECRSSRMWFSAKQIWTKELDELKARNRSGLEKELAMCILDYMAKFQADLQGVAKLSAKNIADLMGRLNVKINRAQIATIREKWGVEAKNASGFFFYSEASLGNGEFQVMREQQKDRHYVFHEKQLLDIVPEYSLNSKAENDEENWIRSDPEF